MATFEALVNNRVVWNTPFQEVLNTFMGAIRMSGIPGVATAANAFTLQRTTADIGVYSTSTILTQADYNSHTSGFGFGSVLLPRKNYITSINLTPQAEDNLMDYRTAAGGFDLTALKALADFIGVKFSNGYLKDVMDNLQANLTAQLSDYPTHFTKNLAGKIDWTLTDQTAPSGQTKILDLINIFYALFPPEMLPGGELSGYVVGYVSQYDFKTMQTSLSNAYQYNPTGGFEMGRNVYSYASEQITLDQAEVRMMSHDFAEIILGNIKFRPLVNLQKDTLLLTYQKIERNKMLYYEKVPPETKQNLYFGMSGDFAYQKELVENIYSLVNEPYTLPLTMGRLVFVATDAVNFVTNIKMLMGSGLIVQDPSRLFALFPNA